MTVEQLIQTLEKLPRDSEVIIYSSNDGIDYSFLEGVCACTHSGNGFNIKIGITPEDYDRIKQTKLIEFPEEVVLPKNSVLLY